MSAEAETITVPIDVSQPVTTIPEELDDLPEHLLPAHLQGLKAEAPSEDAPESVDEPTDVLAEVSMLVPEEGTAVTSEDGTEAVVGGASLPPESTEAELEEEVVPFDGTVTLTTGHILNVRPIKTRQFLRLVKILLSGSPDMIPLLIPENSNFKVLLQAAFTNAMYNEPDTMIEFIQGAVQIRPEDFIGKSQQEKTSLINEINQAFLDPEPEDSLAIIAGVIALDGDHLEALGKRIVEMAKKPLPR